MVCFFCDARKIDDILPGAVLPKPVVWVSVGNCPVYFALGLPTVGLLQWCVPAVECQMFEYPVVDSYRLKLDLQATRTVQGSETF